MYVLPFKYHQVGFGVCLTSVITLPREPLPSEVWTAQSSFRLSLPQPNVEKNTNSRPELAQSLPTANPPPICVCVFVLVFQEGNLLYGKRTHPCAAESQV